MNLAFGDTIYHSLAATSVNRTAFATLRGDLGVHHDGLMRVSPPSYSAPLLTANGLLIFINETLQRFRGTVRYQRARAHARCDIRRAKSEWVLENCTVVNDGLNGHDSGGKVACMNVAKALKVGLTTARRAPQTKVKVADGTLATSLEEIQQPSLPITLRRSGMAASPSLISMC